MQEVARQRDSSEKMNERKQAMRNGRVILQPFRLLCLASLAAVVLLLTTHPALGQNDDVASEPVALVRRAAQNELNSSNGGHPYRYQLHKVDDNKITTKEIVETKEGDVARLI